MSTGIPSGEMPGAPNAPEVPQSPLSDGLNGRSTMVQVGPMESPRDGAASTFTAWCVSALVLGTLSAAGFAISFVAIAALSSTRLPGANHATQLFALLWLGIQELVAILFVAGAIGGLMTKEWGRQALSGACIAAMVCLVIDYVAGNVLIASSPAANTPFGQGVQTGVRYGSVVGDGLKFLYCACLLTFMQSARARSIVTR